MQACSNFGLTAGLNYHLGNGNPHMKDIGGKKGFSEQTNVVVNGSAVHSQKFKIFLDGEPTHSECFQW